MKAFLLFMSVVSMVQFSFAQTTPTTPPPPKQTTVPDSDIPKTERYCDPVENADVLTKIKQTQQKIDAMDGNDPNKMALLIKLGRLNSKIKCINRPIQD